MFQNKPHTLSHCKTMNICARVATFISTTLLLQSCGVSKDCQQLAERFLAKSYSEASANNGFYYKSLFVANNQPKLVDEIPTPSTPWASWKLWSLTGTLYQMDSHGHIIKSTSTTGYEVYPIANLKPAEVLVSSPSQIACRYSSMDMVLNPSQTNLGKVIEGAFVFETKTEFSKKNGFGNTYGANIIVTENGQGIRSEEY